MSPRPAGDGKRERTKAQNRAAILEAARVVFAELGYDAAGVRDVIRRTNLASGTFYNYFPDKETVFRAVVEESSQEVRRRLRRVRAGAQDLESFVGDAYRAWFEFLVEDQLMFELLQRNAATIRALFGDPVLGAGVDELLDDLRAAIRRGELPPLDADYMAGAMAGVALELGVRMAERSPADADGAARFATQLFLGGIARLGSGVAGEAGAAPAAAVGSSAAVTERG
jgi:AcrR family transcriptional regulator